MTRFGIGVFCLVTLMAVPICKAQLETNSPRQAFIPNNSKSPPAPPITSTNCPVNFFRDLLAKKPAERSEMLADRPIENRKRILAKVREYEAMRADTRDLRLRLTELHWYMLPLLSVAPTNRPADLSYIPEGVRKLVQVRLQEWDRLAPETRADLLENQAALQYLTETQDLSTKELQRIQESLSPQRREMLERGISQVQAMPVEQRNRMLQSFRMFFELTPGEREKALTMLSDPERRQMEKTLKSLENLPQQQREQCIRSFNKFANMSLAERHLFLKNAERWKLMRPEERQNWRELVEQMPLMPPEIPDRKPPPVPPGATENKGVATNR